MDFDRYADPPGSWSTSLANVAEVMIPCLEAAGARSVAEVGAYAGDLTVLLADWAAGRGGRVVAIDPSPQEALERLDRERDDVELIRQTSLEALPELELPDAVVIDGDHNYWTVSEELRLIAERTGEGRLPLLLFHDVCWPHARRDDYFEAAQIPEGYRHEQIGDRGGLVPDDPGVAADGLPYPRSATAEGGERNGVLTAVEDFVATREDLRLAVVPAFFGLGVVWSQRTPWGHGVADVVRDWDRNPLLGRMEANRVRLLAGGHATRREAWAAQERLSKQEVVLRRLLDSSAFAVAERLSRLRARAGIASQQSVISKEEIRRALDD